MAGPINAAGRFSLYANQIKGGTFIVSGDITQTAATANAITLRGSNTQGVDNVVSGLISDGTAGGSFSVLKHTSGGSSWTLSNSGNTFSGGVTVGSGSLYTPSVGNIGSASALGTNGTINVGVTTYSGSLVYTGSGETSNKSLNLAGTTGSASIWSSGTGGLTLTGTVTATGAGAKTLNLSGNNNTTYINTISGAIVDSSGGATSVAKNNGKNIWRLSGVNTYTGTTTVSTGTLLIDGSIGAGAVSVASGATLGGHGIIGGNTTIASGAFLAPGNSPGLLTFNSALTLSGTTLLEIDGTTRGTTYDALNVGGLLTYGGAISIDFGNALASGGTYSLFTALDGISAPTVAGHATSVLLTGNGYDATLTQAGSLWSAMGVNGYNFSFNETTGTLSAAAIPEPGTYAAIGGLLALIGAAIRRRRQRQR